MAGSRVPSVTTGEAARGPGCIGSADCAAALWFPGQRRPLAPIVIVEWIPLTRMIRWIEMDAGRLPLGQG